MNRESNAAGERPAGPDTGRTGAGRTGAGRTDAGRTDAGLPGAGLPGKGSPAANQIKPLGITGASQPSVPVFVCLVYVRANDDGTVAGRVANLACRTSGDGGFSGDGGSGRRISRTVDISEGFASGTADSGTAHSGTAHSGAVDSASITASGNSERDVLGQVTRQFKRQVSQLLASGQDIPWIEPPLPLLENEQVRSIPVHL